LLDRFGGELTLRLELTCCARAFTLWTGVEAPLDVMRSALITALDA